MKEVKEENETRETRKASHCNDEAIQVSQNAMYAIKKKFNHKHWLTQSLCNSTIDPHSSNQI